MELKTRISLTLFLFSLLAALVLGGVGYLTNEKIEEEIWLHMLNSELDFQIKRKGGEGLENFEKLPKAFLYEGDPLKSLGQVPVELQTLQPGLHDEISYNGNVFCALVKDVGSKRYYLVFDISELEETETMANFFALTAILLILGSFTLVSFRLANWLVKPIEALASEVSELEPGEFHQPISKNFRDSELMQIAEAIDGFMNRLHRFIRREREFISMVSHEFRTPLAVISGAGDVLSATPKLPKSTEKPIERINRTTSELDEMLSALLQLTREEASEDSDAENQRLDQILREVIETKSKLIKNKNVALHAGEIEKVVVNAPKALLKVAVANLIRNALQNTPNGKITVTLKGNKLSVRDTGLGIPEVIQEKFKQQHTSEDFVVSSGLGLYIVHRVAEQYGWEFDLAKADEGGTISSIVF